jgi:hypothetical protein
MSKHPAPLKPLSSIVSTQRQGVQLQRIYAIGEHRIRTTVYVDSYDFQSWAKAERWNGERWYEVATIPYGAMYSTKKASYVKKPDVNEPLLNVDTQTLLARVKEVLE